ncbi:MAG: hypothetical protein K2P58_10835 [Hyphomonadaceae bacterium]|nr:hypothetical protein [Hyphomonadaceae bacterium]
MRWLFAVVVLFAVCWVADAPAQTNTVMQHYRAYVAALERGDIDTAVVEARAALSASETRDGGGGRTAVLALNLASAELQAGRPSLAQPAAQRAWDLARAGAQSVDAAYTELILMRATLGAASDSPAGEAAARRMEELLFSETQAFPEHDLYAAAIQLGNWSLSRREFATSRRAWALAGANPAGSELGEEYGLARARTLEAVSIILAELADGSRIDEGEAHAAHALLSQAERTLRPMSQIESPTLQLTLAQRTYAEALAWRHALESKLSADGLEVPPSSAEAQGDADGLRELGRPLDLTRPRCLIRVAPGRMPEYPRSTEVATVVLFFRIGADGQIAHHEVAAQAGSHAFSRAIERVIGTWRVEQLSGSTPGCRLESNILQVVKFVQHPDNNAEPARQRGSRLPNTRG